MTKPVSQGMSETAPTSSSLTAGLTGRREVVAGQWGDSMTGKWEHGLLVVACCDVVAPIAFFWPAFLFWKDRPGIWVYVSPTKTPIYKCESHF